MDKSSILLSKDNFKRFGIKRNFDKNITKIFFVFNKYPVIFKSNIKILNMIQKELPFVFNTINIELNKSVQIDEIYKNKNGFFIRLKNDQQYNTFNTIRVCRIRVNKFKAIAKIKLYGKSLI